MVCVCVSIVFGFSDYVFVYSELLKMTCEVANVLISKGIQKGDVVVIYMPTMPLAVASMLACARIGAVHW